MGRVRLAVQKAVEDLGAAPSDHAETEIDCGIGTGHNAVDIDDPGAFPSGHAVAEADRALVQKLHDSSWPGRPPGRPPDGHSIGDRERDDSSWPGRPPGTC